MRISMRPMLPIQDPHVIEGLRSKAHEKLFSGPRNCIKTTTCLTYAFSRHEAYDNFQSEILRTELKTMGAVYDTINNNILRYPLGDRRNPFEFKASSKDEPRPHILFANGGKMVFAGMDNSEKALGSEMDLVIYSQGERETSDAAHIRHLGVYGRRTCGKLDTERRKRASLLDHRCEPVSQKAYPDAARSIRGNGMVQVYPQNTSTVLRLGAGGIHTERVRND